MQKSFLNSLLKQLSAEQKSEEKKVYSVMTFEYVNTDNMSLESIEKFLAQNPEFLDNYVMKNVDTEQLERWLIRKTQKNRGKNITELYTNLSRQRKLNTFLLHIVKHIFQDMMSMDIVISKIMDYAKKLVNADRTSLFLVDYQTKQLYAHIFEVNDHNEEKMTKKEIRFPIGTGLAGYVAQTGKPLNIENVYEDDRFNKAIDQQTGYRTKNLLCMPIFIKNKVIGVVQMVNKINGHFTKEDEDNFAVFATYCGLALDHARLYDKIRKSEQKNKVALEVLSYHNTCNDEELEITKERLVNFTLPAITDPSFSPYTLSNDEKLLCTIKICELFSGIPKIENDDLYRFALTVKKNYRRVPYHNWTHGFSVAHSLYVFFRNSNRFTQLDKMSIFVSGLCHDLDHRGTTNQFLINSSAPLAAIYSTSPLEHHHFNQTVSILQQNGHNILRNMSSSDYKKVLAKLKHCILATDLALFFPNRIKLEPIINGGKFDWNNNEHVLLLEAIAMTAADLNSTARPWFEARDQVKVLFDEFYAQGNVEKKLGRKPIPLMDSDKVNEQPVSQVDFLNNISIPCFKMISKLLPDAHPFLDNCIKNLKLWSDVVAKEKKEREKHELMSKLNEEIEITGDGSPRPVTRNKLERTKSLKMS